MNQVEIRMEREQIEVTSDGTLPPFKADHMRKFVPGLTTYYVTVDGDALPPMSSNEFIEWLDANRGSLPDDAL